MTVLLIILLAVFLIAKYWPRIVVWVVQRHLRKQYQQAYDNAQRGGARQNPWGFGGNGRRQSQPKPRRRKIYSKDEGEYVEFEEIPTYNGGASEQSTRVTYTETETQITDAEWEDL